MLTLVHVTDPQQARALYEMGLLRYSKEVMCDSSWESARTAAAFGNPNHLEDSVRKGQHKFYVQLEE